MRAIVIYEPGGPEVLRLEQRERPAPREGWVLIRLRAFGLNRSELFTRQGHSGAAVTFPRILGIEGVGEVVAAPGTSFATGQRVATAMGGMGRRFDGSYAEYTLVPAAQVQVIDSTLDWTTLAALPEMLQTAWGSLHTALRLAPGARLLVRGGTTSVGLAAIALAKRLGASVAATTRQPNRKELLLRHGADEVFIDDGHIAEAVRAAHPDGVDAVLELVGTTTLLDSLRATARGGTVCMTGMVGDAWTLESFEPMVAIPSAVRLTTYSGNADDFARTPLQELVTSVETGALPVRIGARFPLEEIVEAHRTMEENRVAGKIVIEVA